ncbi:MAG: DEAD/DEAH box helicase [Clostridia bacterium]|nr:DEAD/DEAH box helicase [Clostridia bacterium]
MGKDEKILKGVGKIEIKDVENKFSSAKQTEKEMGRVEKFTSYVDRMERAVDVLDRFDDFDSLKISMKAYEKTPGSRYGIKRDDVVHGDGNVILKHQENAAAMFLKNLRGFGLLADVVGSGKTFEAGVVLSELCYRGKVGTLLVVALGEVIDSWREVLCEKFGLGDCLQVITRATPSCEDWRKIIERKGLRPTHPILVDLQVFKMWADSNVFSQGCVFDMIIVDEAHELCNENNLPAMAQLSRMIQEKRRDGSGSECYCLMLSATPHNGDLKGMFPLWYFIRRRGGDPREFFAGEGANNAHGADYLAERAFYTGNVCKGAENISDFVKNKKLEDFRRREDNITTPIRAAFEAWLAEKGRAISAFDIANDWYRISWIDEFLEEPSNSKWMADENRSVAQAYKELLGLIMIRQPRSEIRNISVYKKVVNLYFCPVRKGSMKDKKFQVQGPGGVQMELDFKDTIAKFPDKYYPQKNIGGYKHKLFDDIPMAPQKYYAAVSRALMTTLSGDDYAVPDADALAGFKPNYLRYYDTMLANYPDKHSSLQTYQGAEKGLSGQFNLVMPYEYALDADSYKNKLSYVVKILQKHKNERVIIFFDYDLPSNREKVRVDGTVEPSLYDRLETDLKAALKKKGSAREFISVDASKAADPDSGDDSGISRADLARFNDDANPDCILIVKGGYTHGANLQKAAVIINFQVSCNPVDMEQKIGRIFRLGQSRNVTVYSLADVNRLEGYALAYFTGIGLFAVDNGDATILSGCNDSNMVCVQCRECKKVLVMPQKEYDTYMGELRMGGEQNGGYISRLAPDERKAYVYVKSQGKEMEATYRDDYENNPLICKEAHADKCMYLMDVISNAEFVCSKDATHRLSRSSAGRGGYKCMDMFSPRIMCSTGAPHKRVYFCNKLCALSKCREHRDQFPDCEAVSAYEAGELYINAVDKCLHSSRGGKCPHYDACKRGLYRCSCLPPRSDLQMADSVSECMKCFGRGSVSFDCTPGPYVLDFDDNWGTECPVCRAEGLSGARRGKLEQVKIKTFSGHIQYLWNSSLGDAQFCDILDKEFRQVKEIEEIREVSGDADN